MNNNLNFRVRFNYKKGKKLILDSISMRKIFAGQE